MSGGTLAVTGGGAISNAVTLSGGSYTVAVNAAGSYASMAKCDERLWQWPGDDGERAGGHGERGGDARDELCHDLGGDE